jgi:hypothetical protein
MYAGVQTSDRPPIQTAPVKTDNPSTANTGRQVHATVQPGNPTPAQGQQRDIDRRAMENADNEGMPIVPVDDSNVIPGQ